MTGRLIALLAAGAVISYLIGSLNSAIISVRLLKGKDIRDFGSKNAGLTNTLRCFGKLPAALTLAGDLLKGIVSALICRLLFHVFLPEIGSTVFLGYFSGIFAILGHVFPLYYKFKGGKGVLVSCSILLVVDPLTFCIIIPFFALMVAVTKYVSVSSITAASVYPLLTFAVQYFLRDMELKWVLIDTGLVVITSIILIWMHRENIKRLKAGTENKFSFGGKKA